MPAISQSKKHWDMLYQGFDTHDVGLGTVEPNIYHSRSYQRRKVDVLLIGGLQSIQYTGSEHDPQPLILAVAYEPAYNTIIAYNLNYLPIGLRQRVIRSYLESNRSRIRNQLPLIVDYSMLQRMYPQLRNVIRRYKVIGIRILNQYPLNEWSSAIRTRGTWSNWHRQDQSRSSFDYVGDFFKRYMGNPSSRR